MGDRASRAKREPTKTRGADQTAAENVHDRVLLDKQGFGCYSRYDKKDGLPYSTKTWDTSVLKSWLGAGGDLGDAHCTLLRVFSRGALPLRVSCECEEGVRKRWLLERVTAMHNVRAGELRRKKRGSNGRVHVMFVMEHCLIRLHAHHASCT